MKTTCFIVDDSLAGRERLKSLLHTFFNYELKLIGEANSATSAIEQIISLKPNISFLDIEMPGMSGLELAEKLQEKGYKGKIIFVTSHIHYSVKAIRANAFDYLLKPVDVDELKKCLERYNNQNRGGFHKDIITEFELSEREVELIEHLSKGLSSEEVAEQMKLSRYTIDTHRRNIHTKTGTRNVVELLNLLRHS